MPPLSKPPFKLCTANALQDSPSLFKEKLQYIWVWGSPASSRAAVLGGQGNYKASFGKITLAAGLARTVNSPVLSCQVTETNKTQSGRRETLPNLPVLGAKQQQLRRHIPDHRLRSLPSGTQCPTSSVWENCSTGIEPALPAHTVIPEILLGTNQHNHSTCRFQKEKA